MPTQRDLARRLGLNQSTVSLALRGSSLIPEKTRKRVEREAKRLGYHPNPMVASLMGHIRNSRPVKEAGCLAIVVDFPDETAWLAFHQAYRQQYAAIRQQATRRGYRTECFFLRAPGMSPAVVDRILNARGIVGLILAGPRMDESYPVKMQWHRYAVVKAGYTWEEPSVDCVNADNRQHVELAFRKLAERGCRRIGFSISRRMVPRADSNWVAGYLIAQRKLPPARRIPMFVADRTAVGRKRFLSWINKWKPDALIGGNTEKGWLEDLDSFEGIFCSRCRYPDTLTPAIEENDPIIGATLCDLVIQKVIHNERGLSEHPRRVLINGTWHGGAVRHPRKVLSAA